MDVSLGDKVLRPMQCPDERCQNGRRTKETDGEINRLQKRSTLMADSKVQEAYSHAIRGIEEARDKGEITQADALLITAVISLTAVIGESSTHIIRELHEINIDLETLDRHHG